MLFETDQLVSPTETQIAVTYGERTTDELVMAHIEPSDILIVRYADTSCYVCDMQGYPPLVPDCPRQKLYCRFLHKPEREVTLRGCVMALREVKADDFSD